jgi:NADPH-dependent curcumin reductase CurA
MWTAAERCLPGRKREKGEGIMNENVDSMMIRLVGLALAVLMMAGMTIYTGLFKKTSDMDTHAAVISVPCGRRGCSVERLR